MQCTEEAAWDKPVAERRKNLAVARDVQRAQTRGAFRRGCRHAQREVRRAPARGLCIDRELREARAPIEEGGPFGEGPEAVDEDVHGGDLAHRAGENELLLGREVAEVEGIAVYGYLADVGQLSHALRWEKHKRKEGHHHGHLEPPHVRRDPGRRCKEIAECIDVPASEANAGEEVKAAPEQEVMGDKSTSTQVWYVSVEL